VDELDFQSKHTNNKAMELTDLHACRTPARLAFADHVNRFIAGDRAPRAPERTEMLTRAYPALDRPMILFQNIVEALDAAVLAKLSNGEWVSGMLVGVDDPRRRMVRTSNALASKRSAAAASRFAERRKSIVAPVDSTARYKYTHLPFTQM
jgi:hypothetical protein